jgi:replicative DNA helicase
MNELNDTEFNFLSLITNYPYLIENTIVKKEYLSDKAKIMFNILQIEYNLNKCFILERLRKNYKNFCEDDYIDLFSNCLYNSSRDIMFKQFEKEIIDNYKRKQYEVLTKNFDGDCNKLYDDLTKINDINCNENDYIRAEDMFKTLTNKKKQVKFNYPHLDYSLNLSQNDLLILAGSTGGFKTAFALNMLYRLSNEYQCVYFNMEMSKNIIYKRLLAIATGIEIQKLNDINRLPENQKQILKTTMEKIEENKIILINKSMDIKEIKREIASIKSKRHIIAFVDHIGLVKSSGNSLYEKMTNVAKELRSISLNYDCTLIGLCQLSRESQKNNTEPKLQDLRDSGEIEQSARKVIMLHNVSKNQQDREQNINVIIAKNDDGNKVIRKFKVDKYIQRFTEEWNER